MFTISLRKALPALAVSGVGLTHLHTRNSEAAAGEFPFPKDPNLKELTDFVGKWEGTGFNMIALPFFDPKTKRNTFRLRNSKTRETFEFKNNVGTVPNRSFQDDPVNIFGLTYQQEVVEVTGKGKENPIHIENGFFLQVPASTDPAMGNTIVRLATIPHGDSLVAQSTLIATVPQGPIIDANLSSTPFITPGRKLNIPGDFFPNGKINLGYDAPYKGEKNMPKGIDSTVLRHPNLLLLSDIKDQTILETVVFTVATDAPGLKPKDGPAGGVVNIPFIKSNANVPSMTSTFWLEKVQLANGDIVDQLQYTQTVIIQFGGIDWPHVSVATLRRVKEDDKK